MSPVAAPGGLPSTRISPEAVGIIPSTACNSVVLPEPLDPMTAMMPPDGTSKVPSDQISRPPRTTLTSSKDSAGAAGAAASSGGDTERLGQRFELVHLPSLERIGPGRHSFGDLDDGNTRCLGGAADLFGHRALGLGVVDQHVDALGAEQSEERVEVAGRRVRIVARGGLVALRRPVL